MVLLPPAAVPDGGCGTVAERVTREDYLSRPAHRRGSLVIQARVRPLGFPKISSERVAQEALPAVSTGFVWR